MSTNNNEDTAPTVPKYFQPERLEPLRDLFDDPEFRIIGQTAIRAYEHIQNRTIEQRNFLSSTVTWLFFEIGKGLTEYDDEESLSKLVKCCSSQWLNLATRTVDLRQQDEVPDAQWAEYFAILTLQILEHIIKIMPQPEPDMADAFYPGLRQRGWLKVFPFVQNAQMALAYADAYAYKNDDYKPPKEATIKLHAHKGGIKKNANTNALKLDFITYCQDHQKKPSVRELATRFYQSLPKERQQLLTPTNAERTLCDAMTNHEKGRLPKHFYDNN